MTGKGVNTAASIRQRLLNIAREQKVDFNRILTDYGLQRLLFRLSASKYRDEFVLKGAMLFSYWSGDVYRATKDIDFLKSGDASIAYLKQVFIDLSYQDVVPDDGLIFDPASVKAEEIREEDSYGGIRVTLKATLSGARVSMQADIGIGDVITPAAQDIEYPVLLDLPSPKLKAYPVETVIAEKFEAMVYLGFANSRMKDFYDIWALLRFMKPDHDLIAKAIANTFRRRGTALPSDVPVALTSEFSRDDMKQKQWAAFVRRAAVGSSAKATLHETVEEIRPLLLGLVDIVRNNDE
ncbi:putative nucleotidyltransferase component of viral defense system [Mariprofundus aestuarium]|uniref:Putative nucleotidyltransferase component of viral defense system n=1 Tax=Mariprofundus aestuarium TaxID=1921086 RepID=A0A2K8L3Y5_MARES|nr:nucleotidyl transferase AbiEii/AbiGii toxin family protein [Mariprofundus aestuarium]ATX79674.1 putative nucleotidyltransferase component of viral defense system [Mariprofundus aestuarium]